MQIITYFGFNTFFIDVSWVAKQKVTTAFEGGM